MRQLLKETEARLRSARNPDARAEAEFLIGGILGIGRGELGFGDRTVDAKAAARIHKAVDRRVGREPLAYVLGSQPFFDIQLKVKPGVFIPRPETEQLVEVVLALYPSPRPLPRGERGSDNPSPFGGRVGRGVPCILDLCSGSGAVAIALAKRLPAASVVAVEKSAATLRVARSNAKLNGARVRFFVGDLFAPLRISEGFDIIVSNPPYVPTGRIARLSPEVRKEPLLALDGGKDGLDVIRRIVAGAPRHLKPGGWLMMEMDPGQTRPVVKLMRDAGFDSIDIVKDFQARSRIVSGRSSIT